MDSPRRNDFSPPSSELGESTGPTSDRSVTWRWYICVLLLFATVVNYMDRLTVNNLAKVIQDDFGINNENYGFLETGFGLAFALGSLVFGWLVDRVGVFWLYPIVLLGWSAAGFMTGLSSDYNDLIALRIMLGFFEAGHFPCGLKVVQILLPPRDRAMGNSLLQGGTALGAIIAPWVIRLLLTDGKGGWRQPFLVIGAAGCVWLVFWFLSIRRSDLRVEASARSAAGGSRRSRPDPDWGGFFKLVWTPQYLALAVLVTCINLTWHIFRVWLPKFLQEARGLDLDTTLMFTSGYYLAADAGILLGGLASSWLVRRGVSVFGSRMTVYTTCCAMTTLTTVATFLPDGVALRAVLLVVAAGSLGCFTLFYSLTQDLSTKHQGKLSGSLATITWLVSAAIHPLYGRYLDRTHDYELVIGACGWMPPVALVVVLLLWRRGRLGAELARQSPPAASAA